MENENRRKFIEYKEYSNLILNGIDHQVIGIGFMINICLNKNYFLPNILDYRNDLLPIRNQGSQGSCYAQAASCMKEWQEKRDYGLNEYLSPQFFYNNRSNLYDDISNNDEGMYGRNVMKLLKNIGICKEKIYPYGLIEDKKKINEACYLQAKEHCIKSYGKIISLEALKYSLKYNGPV